jgi:saposin
LCKHFVEAYLPKLIELLIQKQPPEVVCKELGLCPKAIPVPDGTITCPLCKFVVSEVYRVIQSDFTEQAIRAALDKVCEILPIGVRDLCKTFVDSSVHELVEFILKKMPPEKVCLALHYCDGKTEVAGAVPCSLCMFIVGEAEKMLKDSRTEEAVIKALEIVCGKLPPGMSDACRVLVRSYLPSLIELLIAKQPPEVVCKEIGLCPKVVPTEVAVKAVPWCEVCTLVIAEAEKMIASNYTEAKIIEVLDKVCKILPVGVRELCESMVTEYTPVLIRLLLEKESPDVICRQLKLCRVAPKLRGDSKCVLCKIVLAEVEKILADDRTQEAIEKALSKVCYLMPEEIRDPCNAMVHDYLPLLIAYFEKKEPPETICRQIHICA